jgi:hypothetical protein
LPNKPLIILHKV